MGLLVDSIPLPVERWQLEEILDKRLDSKYNTKFSEFFVIARYARFHKGSVETKYGKLPIFFTPECPPTKVFLLNKQGFDYPKEKKQYINFSQFGFTNIN